MNKQFPRFTSLLLMCFTFSLTATAQVVDIPDPNLRAAIENVLRKAAGAPITVDEMATLTEFNARDASISDLTGLGFATNLITLRLHNNGITDISPLSSLTELRGLFLDNNDIADISPLSGLIQLGALGLGGNNISDIVSLAGLTHLKTLRLNHNRISDISPLSSLIELTVLQLNRNYITDLSPLVANEGLESGAEVNMQENPLSHTSIKNHIPTLQSRGATVKFDDTTHLNFGEPRTVRLIYFLPNDHSPQRDIDTKLDTLIREVQQFYADQMQNYGFGGKTFAFETDAAGKAVVHHVEGQFTDSYYRQHTFRKVWEEIREQFHTSQNIYFIAIDIGNERVGRGYNEACSVGGSHGASSGHVLIPASGDCFNLKTAAHELGHAFGLQHDFRSDTYIMSFGRNPNRLSECTAEWLDAHRHFNTAQSQPHFDTPTTIRMLSPFASPPYAIGLRFEVTDPDGLHQAQLLTPATIRKQDRGQLKFLSCKRLNGETNTIVTELITNQLTVESDEVILSVIDVYGNVTSQIYPIDITTIFSTEIVSRPDKNQTINIPEPVPLPLTVRDAFELDSLYQQWIDVEGFPVVASEKVNPYALKEAAWLIRQMIGHRPDVLQALVQNRARLSLIVHNEIPTQIPEYSDGRPNFLAYLMRGFGVGLRGHPTVTLSEEHLLPDPDHSHFYNAAIHGFAHSIHLSGLNTIDPAFDSRLKIAYDAAMEKGLWQGTYAASDRREYWAEGTQGWFHPKGGSSSFNGNTRGALKAYDPRLAALLVEVYGDSEWRYTLPTARTHLPHLQGFSLRDLPTSQLLPELEELEQQFRNPNSDGGDYWVDLRPYDPSLIPILNESRTVGNLTEIAFFNLTQANVLLYEVGYDGTESFWFRVAPGVIRSRRAFAHSLWLIKDSNGKNLAAFQAVEKVGRFLIEEVLYLITPGLSKVSGDNQTGVFSADLTNPFVIEIRDETLSVLEGISVTFAVIAGDGTLSVTSTTTDLNGRAQSTLTLGPNLGTNTVEVSASGIQGSVIFNTISDTEAPPISADINSDGVVNVLDLVVIASELGKAGTNLAADVNGDGVVNILDLILVAGMFEDAAAAPSAQPQVPETLTAVEIHGWLTDARALEIRDPTMKRGFSVLEQLLIALTPKETELLANYPNPFNPETWIPYRLAEDAFVTLAIYDPSGRVVRTFDVGHRIASVYENRSKAIHWDGKNNLGEQVASGIYFYQLRVENSRSETEAGDYAATRKMVILK